MASGFSAARLDVDLGGGGVAANIEAWERVVALGGVLGRAAETTGLEGLEGLGPKKTVTFADEAQKDAGANAADPNAPPKTTDAKLSFFTGEWALSLPWTTPEGGARAVRLLVDASARGDGETRREVDGAVAMARRRRGEERSVGDAREPRRRTEALTLDFVLERDR